MDYELFDDDNEEIDQFCTTLSKKELANARSRLRGKLKRDTDSAKTSASSMANYILNNAATRDNPAASKVVQIRRKGSALAIGVSNLSKVVLQSLGVNVPVKISTKNYGPTTPIASGSTDFKSISISVNPAVYREHDEDAVAELIHLTKGVMYHEGGHNLWTVPYGGLLTELIKLGHPIKDRACTLEEFGEDKGRIMEVHELHKAWNVLEDQRMETAMCTTSPVMASYFTTLVLKVVLNLDNAGSNWPYIVGRTYLPKEIRLMIREAADGHKYAHLIDRINDCVMRYRRSTDYIEMFECVVEFAQYMILWGVGSSPTDGHDNWATFEGTTVKPGTIPMPEHYELEKPRERKNSATGETGVEAPKVSDDASDGGETPSNGNKGSSKGNPDKELENLINDEVTKNTEAVSKDEVHEFMSQINEVLSREVLPDETITRMSPSEVDDSKQVCNGMINVLEQLVVQVDPAWTFHMEQGVLDPTAFMTKEIGDTDYWSGLDGSGGNGHNLSVSVLLDSSGSMGGFMESLSIAAMGIRKACDHLNIPCTITTFNDDVRMVASADMDVDFIKVGATGGTSPYTALSAMTGQRCDKDFHLVVILTDGEWSDINDVRPWCVPGRYFIIAGLGWGIEDTIKDKGADHYVVLNNVLELPKVVTHALVGFFK